MEDARDFSSRLLELLRDERKAAASFLVALAPFDERRLWVQLRYSSLCAAGGGSSRRVGDGAGRPGPTG